MKVYKQNQFLVFDLDDGKTVKYDFAKKQAIGKSGKPVNDLRSQLSGLTIDDIFNNCTDKNYANFLRWIQNKVNKRCGYNIKNIGTILSHVDEYSRFEQFYSAGIELVIDEQFKYSINDIPKGLIKICRDHGMKITNDLLKFYKEIPDAYNLPYKMEFISINDDDLKYLFVHTYWNYNSRTYCSKYNTLICNYGYTAKGLLNYLDYCKTFEAFNYVRDVVDNLHDYAVMMSRISPKFDKYPRHLLTTHQIAVRNYNRLKQVFDEEAFKKRINHGMEKTFGEYRFYYPESTQAIKDEAVSQNNCVASYISRVIDGNCDILFLRKKAFPEESLVTIEVQNGKIVQAKQKFNDPVTKKQQDVINQWNEWYAKKSEQMK